MKIMIADDSKFGRGMVHTYAKTIFPDAEFIPAGNGAEAVEIFEKHFKDDPGIDMVFLDYLMPDMDGLASAAKLLEIDKTVFIVMVTSNLQDPVREKAEALGIKFFFNKPVKKDDLLEVKQRWEQQNQ